jgi:signal transduction histidine kinase
MQVSTELMSHSPTRQEINAAVTEGVRAPLAALRASMESLSHAFQPGDPRSLAVHGALEEVVRLGHEMQTILDYALPQPTRPLSCSLLEIACSARAALQPEHREQVLLAIEDRRARLTVDGALLSRSIARMLEAALAGTPSHVLLRSRLHCGEAVFALVHATPPPWNARATLPRFRSAATALGREIAQRDVERMGGSFALRHDPGGSTVLEFRFPVEVAAKACA